MANFGKIFGAIFSGHFGEISVEFMFKKIDGWKQMKMKGDASGYCAWCLLAIVSSDHLALFHGEKILMSCHQGAQCHWPPDMICFHIMSCPAMLGGLMPPAAAAAAPWAAAAAAPLAVPPAAILTSMQPIFWFLQPHWLCKTRIHGSKCC